MLASRTEHGPDLNQYASTSPSATHTEWARLLDCCKQQLPIGFGMLDSFLSGVDIDRRIDLVVAEAKTNVWLRLELRDTLTLNQSRDWSTAQRLRLTRAAEDIPDIHR